MSSIFREVKAESDKISHLSSLYRLHTFNVTRRAGRMLGIILPGHKHSCPSNALFPSLSYCLFLSLPPMSMSPAHQL